MNVRAHVALRVAIAAALTGCSNSNTERAASGRTPDSARAHNATAPMAGMPGMQMSSDGSALLSAAAIKQFGVTFDTAAVRDLQGTLRTVGTVAADESGVVVITTKVGGFIERLDAKVTGQRIIRGVALAAIYSPEILIAEEELLVASRLSSSEERVMGRDTARALTLLSAARRRLRLLDVSDAQIDDVLRTQRPQRTTTLVAPITGVLTQRLVSQGQAVQPGMLLFMISDLSKLWIDVRIPAGSSAGLRDGMLASYTVSGVAGRRFTGRVSYVYPTVSDQSRTLSARVLVGNDDGVLKPGMFATVAIASPGRRVLTVPRAAVIETGERSVVFVDMGGGRLMPHDVELGSTTADFVEILAGLTPGQRVVTSAQYLVESESNLAEVMRSMIGMGSAARTGDTGMQGMDMGGASAPPVNTPVPARH